MAWVLKAHAKSGNADGAGGPFKAPSGSGTVDTTGADLYVIPISNYDGSEANFTGATVADAHGNVYTYVNAQLAAGDPSNRVSFFYCLNPVTSPTEQWVI